MSIYPLYILYAYIGKSITLPQQTKQTPAPHPSHSVQLGRYLFDCFTRAFGACRGLRRLALSNFLCSGRTDVKPLALSGKKSLLQVCTYCVCCKQLL